MPIILFLLVTVALPIGWGIADVKAQPKIRRAFGVVTILWSFAVAAFVGALRDLNANVYFTGASKDLLTNSVQQLKAGKTEAVIRAWSRADSQFEPTYENRARYRQIVDEAIEEMKKP